MEVTDAEGGVIDDVRLGRGYFARRHLTQFLRGEEQQALGEGQELHDAAENLARLLGRGNLDGAHPLVLGRVEAHVALLLEAVFQEDALGGLILPVVERVLELLDVGIVHAVLVQLENLREPLKLDFEQLREQVGNLVLERHHLMREGGGIHPGVVLVVAVDAGRCRRHDLGIDDRAVAAHHEAQPDLAIVVGQPVGLGVDFLEILRERAGHVVIATSVESNVGLAVVGHRLEVAEPVLGREHDGLRIVDAEVGLVVHQELPSGRV